MEVSNKSDYVYANDFFTKGVAVRGVVGATCCLSIVGSFLIAMSYICFKQLRTKARLVLVHISIMDFGVAAANLIGLTVYFDHFYQVVPANPNGSASPDDIFIVPPSTGVHNLCVAQAFFAVYFTLGSISWTVCLALYLYFALVYYDSQHHARWFQWFSYVFGYGLPLFISLWLVLTGKLGYSPYNSSGWCTLILIDPATQERDIYAAIIGYDLWIYLTLVLVPLLYLSLKGYLQNEYECNKDFVTEQRFWDAVYILDYKFMLIPLAFTILRVWSCIVTILYVYAPKRVGDSVPSWAAETLIYLSGIGDSGQGIANAFLFILCTSKVRRVFHDYILSWIAWISCNLISVRDTRGHDDARKRQFNSSAEQTPIQHSSFDLSQTNHQPSGSGNPINMRRS